MYVLALLLSPYRYSNPHIPTPAIPQTNPPPGIFGPAATKWFDFLVKRVNLKSTNGTIVARVACDQFLFAPCNMALFLSTMAYMEGNSPVQRLKDAYLPGYQKNLMVWPWVQFTNFKYVPAEMRVLVVNVISLGWNCYLSSLNSAGGTKPNPPVGKTKEGGQLPPS
jgi:protein Mpv17